MKICPRTEIFPIRIRECRQQMYFILFNAYYIIGRYFITYTVQVLKPYYIANLILFEKKKNNILQI